MVAGVVAVGFFLLIEMKAYVEVFVAKLYVHVEARIAGGSEWSNETHFFAIFMLKRVTGAPEEVDGIVGDVFYGEFHNLNDAMRRSLIAEYYCSDTVFSDDCN